MSSDQKIKKLRSFLHEISGTRTSQANHDGGSSGPSRQSDLNRLAGLDYAGPLRRCLNRQQVVGLIADARKSVWPHLNHQPLRLASVGEFAKRYSELGIVVCPTKFSRERSSAMLGFYIKKTEVLAGRPLICVNTAHHPAAIGATFAHEMGHHLTSEIFGTDGKQPAFLEYTQYEKHLELPFELVADVLVSLGIYPRRLAERMFSSPAGSAEGALQGKVSDLTILEYLAKQYGLSFDGGLTNSRKVQYLSGLLHFTKLRESLLKEFAL